ncbi:MAG: hypothetical protein KGD64_08100 [Candidatus Heimdallarchaeota archaeon]|nr:hypothetical protein [Candidatus Heimdallarchaeota archaeon]
MSSEESTVKKRRILRFIRDLDLRYIRGSIDRRTYQTLKNKYQEILTSLPTSLKSEQEMQKIEETKKTLPALESDFQEIDSVIVDTSPPSVPQRTIELPLIELDKIPILEIEELKVRYVMNMAIKAATKTFEDEMNLEQEYVSGKLDDHEYITSKNEVEAKQHKIFQHFYKLSELLFSVSKDHLFKNTHNNFLLFNNELSENINRLRRLESDKPELKGIIYEINNRVLRNRPILKKAAQDTLRWKMTILQEKERFVLFYEINKENLTLLQKETMNRNIKQLEIYEDLLDDDINDYTRDVDALDQIYGEHLRFQEIVTPYFKDLSLEIEERVQRFSEIVSFQQLKNRVSIATSTETKDIDYMVMSELRTLWKFTGKPVIDEENDLVGFLIGPAKLNEQYGILIHQQQEISLSMVRKLYDNVLSPAETEDVETEEQKKQYFLNELVKTLPHVPFTFLIPETIIEYCTKKNVELTNELKEVMRQPDNYLFIPLDSVSKTQRELRIKNENILLNGDLLPYYNPTESNSFTSLITENTDVKVKNVFNDVIGSAHSVLYHPGKGYFLAVQRLSLSDDLFDFIHDILFYDDSREKIEIFSSEKKRIVLEEFSKTFQVPVKEIENPELLKKILVEKNTGILPDVVESAKYDLYSIGNLKIISDYVLLDYGGQKFNLTEVFDLRGKVVENVKGTELGVIHNLRIKEKPILDLWTSIDLLLIASFIGSDPKLLFEKDKNFIDNLAISIAKLMSIAPQVALRPDMVMTFMNLIGKISKIEEIEEMMSKFKPKTIELGRIITVEKQKILADISDKEIMDEIASDIEEGEIDEDKRFVASPDYYLREK